MFLLHRFAWQVDEYITVLFTFHYVSITSSLRLPQMRIALIYYINFPTTGVYVCKRDLHSTMFLLHLPVGDQCPYFDKYLHSTMFLLHRSRAIS